MYKIKINKKGFSLYRKDTKEFINFTAISSALINEFDQELNIILTNSDALTLNTEKFTLEELKNLFNAITGD